MTDNQTIFTIGHSTRSFKEFLDMLRSFNIELLADIRRFPASRKYPHFNKEALEISLPAHQIEYVHFVHLGGRRTPNVDSVNLGWRHTAFRGYADFMQTEQFKNAVESLVNLATKQRTAYMCSEAVWWLCHRSLVSDYLKIRGWKVMHIMNTAKASEHPFTSPAKIRGGKLSYERDE